jgi:hypothetical protein
MIAILLNPAGHPIAVAGSGNAGRGRLAVADSACFACDFGVETAILASNMPLTMCVWRKVTLVGPECAAIRQVVAL